MTSIAELGADRVVEGVYGVAKKERRRTKSGASYLALELVDPSGRIEARVWRDQRGGTHGSPTSPLLLRDALANPSCASRPAKPASGGDPKLTKIWRA